MFTVATALKKKWLILNKGKVGTGIAVVIIVLALLFVAFGPFASTFHLPGTSTESATMTQSSNISSHNLSTTTTTTTTTTTSNSMNTTTSSSLLRSTNTSSATMPVGNGSGSITVVGTTLNGSVSVDRIRVDLRINGTDVASGFTPVTFSNLQQGVQYGVVVYWYGNYYIRYINDSNTGMDLQRYDLVTLNQTNPIDNLTAVFEYVPPSQAASLNIMAEFPNGTRLGTATVVNGYDLHSPGVWLTLTPPFQNTPYTGTFTGGSVLPFILFNHETYVVQMSYAFYGPWVTNLTNSGPVVCLNWSHWKDDGSTNATRAIILDGNATYTAIYDQVPNSSCESGTITTASSMVWNTGPSILSLLVLVTASPLFWMYKRFRYDLHLDLPNV